MARPAEIAQQTGTDAEFEQYVRDNFPQCIQLDENGVELDPVQYTSAYDHEVGVSYIAQLLLENGTYDENGDEITPPVFGGQSLMPDWHVDPEKTEQEDRIQARVELRIGLEILGDDTPDGRVLSRATLIINSTIAPGITYTAPNPPTIAWAGEPPVLPVGRGLAALAGAPGASPILQRALDILEALPDGS